MAQCGKGQSPGTAFPLCGTEDFSQDNVPLCDGELLSVDSCTVTGYAAKNAFWYKFHTYGGGLFTFTIVPNLISEDYDWVIYDITNRDATQVQDNPSWIVAANFAPGGGNTGTATNVNSGPVVCGSTGQPYFNKSPDLQANRDYLLVIIHFANSQQGYKITFDKGAGQANLTNPVPLEFSTAAYDCQTNTIRVTLSKPILCSSITAASEQFQIQGNPATITNVEGLGCDTLFDTKELLFTIDRTLPGGTYTLEPKPGAIMPEDMCGNRIPLSGGIDFNADPPPALQLPTASISGCNPNTIRLDFPQPIAVSSLHSDGSNFSVTGPQAVTVNQITYTDNGGYTVQVILNLAAPLGAPGDYTVSIVQALQGQACTAPLTGDAAPFNLAPGSPATINIVPVTTCAAQQLTLQFSHPVNCSSIAADGTDFNITGPAAVTVAGIDKTNCNGTTTSIVLNLQAPLLTPGSYTVNVAQGSDNSTLIDECGEITPVNTNASFNIDPPQPASIQSIDPFDCATNTITIHFDKAIQCSTLLPANFSLLAPDNSAVNITAVNPVCNNGLATEVQIDLGNRLVMQGNYVLATVNDRVKDNCENFINDQLNIPVDIEAGAGFATYDALDCAPQSIRVHFTKSVQSSSIHLDGNDFDISGPATVQITSVDLIPNTNLAGYATGIVINLQTPLTVPGAYNLVMNATAQLLDSCYQPQDVNNDELTIDVKAIAAPGFQPIGTSNCAVTALDLSFDKAILCNTITANAFQVIDPNNNPVTVSSVDIPNCTNGTTGTVRLNFQDRILENGNYTVRVLPNTLTDNCMQAFSTDDFTWTVNIPPGAIIQSYQPLNCAPESLTITLDKPVQCNTLHTDGADFIISGPSAVSIQEVQFTCNNGETQNITIVFNDRVITGGTYHLQLNNTAQILDACYQSMDINTSFPFNVPIVAAANLSGYSPFDCAPQSFTIQFSNPVKANTIQPDGSDFTISGTQNIQVTGVQLNPNTDGLVQEVTLDLDDRITLAGNYTVQVNSNTIIDACFQPVSGQVSIPVSIQPGAVIQSVNTSGCSPNTLTVQFDKPIQCNTLQQDGSDFSISGPSAIGITAMQSNCNTSGLTSSITLTLNQRIITGGTYNLIITTNSILDECYQPSPVNTQQTFNIASSPEVPFNSVIAPGCRGTIIQIPFTANILCSSIDDDGSQFTISGPGAVNVIGVNKHCNGGVTNRLDLLLSAPILLKGTYTVTLQNGSSGHSILSECYIPTPVGSNANFSTPGTVDATFQMDVQQICENTTVQLSHDGANDVNSWQWFVNGTLASSDQNTTLQFDTYGDRNITLIVSNGTCSDTAMQGFDAEPEIEASFQLNAASFCPQDQVIFTNTSTGNAQSYQWQFGDGTINVTPSPPPKIYPNTGRDETYQVMLIAQSPNGCLDSASMNIKVSATCSVVVPTAFTPNNDGINDYLYPVNSQKTDNMIFRVYNRYGQLLFESRDPAYRWNGQFKGELQPAGTYVWTLEYTDRESRQDIKQKGYSVLIR